MAVVPLMTHLEDRQQSAEAEADIRGEQQRL